MVSELVVLFEFMVEMLRWHDIVLVSWKAWVEYRYGAHRIILTPIRRFVPELHNEVTK